MKKLLDELKKRCGNNSIKFTTTIDFDYDEKLKTVYIKMKKGIKENMQENSAAFEGWALALRANLSDLVEHITLDWDSTMEPSKKNSTEWRHFNRFIYRVDAFKRKYSDWFTVVKQEHSWENRISENGWKDLVLNSPGNRNIIDEIEESDNTSEHDIEVYFTKEGSKKLVHAVEEQFNIQLDQVKNQYPVGIFNNQVKEENYIFTGGKSAIDLYSIAIDKSFNIFELKGEKNIKLGILSELFFYSSLIKDTIDGNFKNESNDLEGINKVNAFFLVQRIHPLISDKVIELLNINDTNISFKKLIYKISNVEFPIA